SEHPFAVGRGDRRGADRPGPRQGRPHRDRHEQLVGHLPDRRAAGHEAARLGPRGPRRGGGPDRGRAREAARAAVQALEALNRRVEIVVPTAERRSPRAHQPKWGYFANSELWKRGSRWAPGEVTTSLPRLWLPCCAPSWPFRRHMRVPPRVFSP